MSQPPNFVPAVVSILPVCLQLLTSTNSHSPSTTLLHTNIILHEIFIKISYLGRDNMSSGTQILIL
jgi:hypothetical protein